LLAKLTALGLRLGQSDRELEDVLAGLATLPANLVVRASREIAIETQLFCRPLGLFWVRKPFSLFPFERELLDRNAGYAWLFLFHFDGYVRQAALDSINDAPTSSFFLAALALRLNDWARPVRQAAQRCAERVLRRTSAEIAVGASLYLLDRRIVWGRWSNEAKVLDHVFERKDVMAGIAAQLALRPTGPLASHLRHALRHPSIDEHLGRLAATAVQPSVRALAYRTLISGKATWPMGYEWAWIDKVYGLRRRVPKLGTRDIARSAPAVADLIREAFHDKSAFVRKVAADALIAAGSILQDQAALIASLAEDPSPAVRERADFMRRHLSSATSS
jgi:hypothetical protein